MDRLVPCTLHMRSWMRNLQPQLPLHYRAYHAHDLINSTISDGVSLHFQQAIEAKEELINYLIREGDTKYDVGNPNHYAIVCRCAVLIDQCFLAGQLTQVERYPNHDGMWHLKIHISGRKHVSDRNYVPLAFWSSCTVEFDDGDANLPPCVRIDIAAGLMGSIFVIVEHLVHEMVHGYLELFSCPGTFASLHHCDILCYDASRSHGAHVQGLLKSIVECIQPWHADLSDFGSREIQWCNHLHRPGGYRRVDRSAFELRWVDTSAFS